MYMPIRTYVAIDYIMHLLATLWFSRFITLVHVHLAIQYVATQNHF